MTDTDESSGRDIHTTNIHHQSILSDFDEFRDLVKFFQSIHERLEKLVEHKSELSHQTELP